MKKAILLMLFGLLCVPTLLAVVPEIKDIKGDEKISISVVYSEPAIREYKYVFTGKDATINENGKLLGKLVISIEDATRIDQHLSAVKRGKRAGRGTFGAPAYTIQYEKSGKVLGTWSYHIERPKESLQPVLALEELKKRLP